MSKFGQLLVIVALVLGVFLNTCPHVEGALVEEELQGGNFRPEGRTKFDDDLRDFVEFIKLQMKCGYEPAGIPPLAPYQDDFVDFNMQGNTWR